MSNREALGKPKSFEITDDIFEKVRSKTEKGLGVVNDIIKSKIHEFYFD